MEEIEFQEEACIVQHVTVSASAALTVEVRVFGDVLINGTRYYWNSVVTLPLSLDTYKYEADVDRESV